MTIPSGTSSSLNTFNYYDSLGIYAPSWFYNWYTTFGLNLEQEAKDTVARNLLNKYIKGYQKLINYSPLSITAANPATYELLDKDLDYKEYQEGLTLRFFLQKGQKLTDKTNLKLSSISDPASGYPLFIYKTKIDNNKNLIKEIVPISVNDLEDNNYCYVVLIKNYNYLETNQTPITVNNTYPEYYWLLYEVNNSDTLNDWIEKNIQEGFDQFDLYLKTCLSEINSDLDKESNKLQQKINTLEQANKECNEVVIPKEYTLNPIRLIINEFKKISFISKTIKLTISPFGYSETNTKVSLKSASIFYKKDIDDTYTESKGSISEYSIELTLEDGVKYSAYAKYIDNNGKSVTSPNISFEGNKEYTLNPISLILTEI